MTKKTATAMRKAAIAAIRLTSSVVKLVKHPALFLVATLGTLTPPAYAQLPFQDSELSPAVRSGQAKHESRSFVPGQIIVKYKDSVTLSVREAVKSQIKFKDITLDRSDSLDKLHKKYSVHKAKPVFRRETEEDAISGPKTLSAIKQIHEQKTKEAINKNAEASAIVLSDTAGPDISHVYVLDLSPGANIEAVATDFARDPHVEYAQPNYIVRALFTPNDTYWATSRTWGQSSEDLWGLRYNDTDRAWDTSQGAGVTVAVVDTGVDYNHPDIAANLVAGWNIINNTSNAMDDFGHGTHVAGIIAATGNNSTGIIGVAPLAKIMPVKFLDNFGTGTIENAAAALVYAAQHGARVINNSWGCLERCPSNSVVEDAVRTAYSLGAVVIFAAGNFTDDIFYYSPQNMSQVILATATTKDDKPNFFSNYGGDLDVSAPGGGAKVPVFFDPFEPNFRNILSLKAAECNPALFCPAELVVGGIYLRQAGTSMSAGYVSGLAALILAKNPTYTAEQVRQAIRISSKEIGAAGPDAATGYGRIRPYDALKAATPLASQITQPSSKSVTGVTQIAVRGITGGPGFKDWTLAYGTGSPPTGWKTLIKDAKIATPIAQDALLTNWNISTLKDGPYTLKLTTRSTNGKTYEDRQPIIVDQTTISTAGAQVLTGGSLFRGNVTLNGTAAPGNFSSYRLQVRNSNGDLLVNPVITLTNGGAQKVYSGVLGTWYTSGIPADNYTVELVITLTNDSNIVESSETFIYDPSVHPGWPVNLGYPTQDVQTGFVGFPTLLDHLTAADINQDGNSDLVIGYGSVVRIFDHTGASLPGWPQTIDPANAGYLMQRSPAVADLDGDGLPEIAAANSNGQVFVWRANGVLLPGWPKQLSYAAPALAASAIDGSPAARIILTTPYGLVNVLDAAGNSLPGWPRQLDLGTFGPPAIGDMNRDGTKEIVVSSDNRVYALDYAGNVLPNWPKSLPYTGTSWCIYPALGDTAGNGAINAVVGLRDNVGQNHAVYVFQYDGQTVALMPTPGPRVNPPALADLNGDGKTDIVAGNQLVFDGGTLATDFLNAWNGDGTVLNPAWPVRVTDPASTKFVYNASFGFGSPTMADIEGRGQVDIIASSDSRLFAVEAFRPDGSRVPGFPKPTVTIGAHETNAVVVADLDGDGLLEMAWVDANLNLWIWDLPTPASSTQPWRMFRRDPGHSASTN